MGVKDLWPVLEPVKQHRCLNDLRGQTIAVDLSIWIVEAKTLGLQHKGVAKPHLRNVFFRVASLLQLDIIPVIVIEGTAPDLKQEVMRKRVAIMQGANGLRRGNDDGTHKIQRRNLSADIRECCEMLEYLGVPYVQSAGEAEAMCAFLNHHNNVVDACITNDGDAFLYGANFVYRNFTMSVKDPHVESYSMADIESKLHLTRESLVALAILLGCDYLPKGVPGVGRELAMKFLSSLTAGESVFQRFDKWQKCEPYPYTGEGKGKTPEWSVWKKSTSSPGFPHRDVMDEFLCSRDVLPTKKLVWKRPKMFHFMTFAKNKMEWADEYGVEKMLPLLTIFDMKQLSNKVTSTLATSTLLPHRIVKTRIRQGIPSFEVEWHKVAGDTLTKAEYYTTVEEQVRFSDAFPQLVSDFQHSTAKSHKRRERTKNRVESKGQTTLLDILTKSVDALSLDSAQPRLSKKQPVDGAQTTSISSLRRRSTSLGCIHEVANAVMSCTSDSGVVAAADQSIAQRGLTLRHSDVNHKQTTHTEDYMERRWRWSNWRDEVDVDEHDDNDDDSIVVDILPLSQRLAVSSAAMPAPTKVDSITHDVRPSIPADVCIKSTVAVDSANSVQCVVPRTKPIKSDSALLQPSKRRQALRLRTAAILSDSDIFMNSDTSCNIQNKERAAEVTNDSDTVVNNVETTADINSDFAESGVVSDIRHADDVDSQLTSTVPLWSPKHQAMFSIDTSVCDTPIDSGRHNHNEKQSASDDIQWSLMSREFDVSIDVNNFSSELVQTTGGSEVEYHAMEFGAPETDFELADCSVIVID